MRLDNRVPHETSAKASITVERTFGWLIRSRRLSRDYERRTDNSEAMIKIAMIRLMATRLAGEQARWSNRVT